jgi:pimeloyl-ACP methyl ester carboxylesterase
MVTFHPILRKSYYILAGLGGLWVVFLISLINPTVQRHVLYLHKINSAIWSNVNEPETFGFAKGQVTPFHLNTTDGETLYCWHVLPTDVYLENEREIVQRAGEGVVVQDLRTTVGYKLLVNDAESWVVVNFHGNTGHLADGHRPSLYRSITSLPSTHLLTCSYRGFGTSTLHQPPHLPTEPGLITDGITLLDHLQTTLSHPSTRTILLGQSLGTAVTAAVALHFASPASTLLPPNLPLPQTKTPPTTFPHILLLSPFPSLPTLLTTYRISGLIPLFSPLTPYPALYTFMTSKLLDPWPTSRRLHALLSAAKSNKAPLKIHILHARNDQDIGFKVGEAVYEGLEAGMRGEEGVVSVHERRSLVGEKGVRRGAFAYRKVEVVESYGARVVEMETVRFGGHNELVGWVNVQLAIRRAMKGESGVRMPGLDVE